MSDELPRVPKTNEQATSRFLASEGITYEEYVKPSYERQLMVWTLEKENEIFERMGNGEPVVHICKDEHLPAFGTWCRWLSGDVRWIPPDEVQRLRERYAHAKQSLEMRLVAECFSIIDDTSRDTLEKELPSGKIVEVPDKEWIQRSIARVEWRKWFLARLAPQKYSERLLTQQEVTVTHNNAMPIDMDGLSTEAKRLLHAFLAQVEEDNRTGKAEVIDANYEEISDVGKISKDG